MAVQKTRLFAPTVVSDGAGTVLFTLAAAPTNLIFSGGVIRFANTTAGAVVISAYVGTVADGNSFVKAKSIAANDYLDVAVPRMLASQLVTAVAGAASSITASQLAGDIYS